MNFWTEKSIELANESDYLDRLFEVYPLYNNPRRQLPIDIEENILDAFEQGDYEILIKTFLEWEIFPIKNSYVSYIKNDINAISRNPKIVKLIAEEIIELGVEEAIRRVTEPKETNRQMGPLFKKWIDTGALGVVVFDNEKDVINHQGNCVYNSSDENMMKFANKYLGCNLNKGLDFIGKYNNKYIIGEAKFLTDFGGHQNAQFADAMNTVMTKIGEKIVREDIIKVAILDGVVYTKNNGKMNRYIRENEDLNIMSSLVLKEFLESL